jgi:hypothetical protein
MNLRFLADESCGFGVVRALRAAGFRVIAVSEVSPGADDNAVIDLAIQERSVLITEDKDFGQLVYAHGRDSLGILFLRYPWRAKSFSMTLSSLFNKQERAWLEPSQYFSRAACA